MKKFIVCAAALACSAAAGLSMAATPAKVMVLLSPGFEEGETVEILDVVRRGGFEVDAVSIAGEYVPGSHNIVLKADRVLSMEMKDLKHFEGYDMIVVPGGWTGVDHLVADNRVIELVKRYTAADKWVAAMCAGPNVLAKAGVIKGKTITAYPGKKTEPFYTRMPRTSPTWSCATASSSRARLPARRFRLPLRSSTPWAATARPSRGASTTTT